MADTAEAGQAGSGPDFRPLYGQVKDLLVRRIAAGELRPGEALPSETRLAAELGVSQGTVRKALDELAAQHLVERRQGRGTFVAEQTESRALFHFFHLFDAEGQRGSPACREATSKSGSASRAEAERLDLAAKAPVIRIDRVRTLDGVPSMVERIVVPAGLFPGLAEQPGDALPNTLYEMFQRDYGVTVTTADEQLRAVAAGAADARKLEVPEGTPLMEIDRVAIGIRGRPVEWRLSRVRTDAHTYRVRLD